MTAIRIYFGESRNFESKNFKRLTGIAGLYFIFLTKRDIEYPFQKSRLIYIGMSEKRSNSIASRLEDHISGASQNRGLINYNSIDNLMFTYINIETLKSLWPSSVETLESYFICNFVNVHGVYPICNNRTVEIETYMNNIPDLNIDWSYFQSEKK